jgi:hypothetical protein
MYEGDDKTWFDELREADHAVVARDRPVGFDIH